MPGTAKWLQGPLGLPTKTAPEGCVRLQGHRADNHPTPDGV